MRFAKSVSDKYVRNANVHSSRRRHRCANVFRARACVVLCWASKKIVHLNISRVCVFVSAMCLCVLCMCVDVCVGVCVCVFMCVYLRTSACCCTINSLLASTI